MSDKGEAAKPPQNERTTSRRSFLGRITGAAAVLAASAGASIGEWGRNKPAATASVPSAPSVEDPGPSLPEDSEKIRTAKLNAILELKLTDPNRKAKEYEFTIQAKTLKEIDLGLEVCTDREIRKALLEKRWKLRNEEKFNLKQLPETHKSWARDNKIHPEVVALCIDNYNLWLDTMRQYQEKGVYSNSVDFSDMVITPYGMAAIAQTESGGFVNIGKYPAEGEIDPDVFSQEYSSFVDLIQSMNAGNLLKRPLANIPGSENPKSRESSGGALGPMQLMASSALGVSRELKESFGNESPITHPNPFSIEWSLLASSILLAEKGYNATDKQKMEKSLLNWNNDRRQAESVLKADMEYRNRYFRNAPQKP